MTNDTRYAAIDEEIVNVDGKNTTVTHAVPLTEMISDYAICNELFVSLSAADLSLLGNAVEDEGIIEE